MAGLLAVLALIVYACRPSDDEGEATTPASSGSDIESGAASEGGGTADPSIPASPPDDADDEEDADAPEENAGDGGASSGGAGGGSAAGVASDGSGGGSRPAAAPCGPEDVVVTVRSDREDYAAGVQPAFTLTLVSTSTEDCTAQAGAETLELRITSGDDRIWSSVDCVGEPTAEPVELRRGVPHTVEITWDRTRSWPDCREVYTPALPGTYVAKVYSDYETAGSQVFRLH
ncbi:MAG TPA: hypothetical protein VKZ89_07840 [Thermobifida alba]|nr:hypothetical protein [Thermobifida alba]